MFDRPIPNEFPLRFYEQIVYIACACTLFSNKKLYFSLTLRLCVLINVSVLNLHLYLARLEITLCVKYWSVMCLRFDALHQHAHTSNEHRLCSQIVSVTIFPEEFLDHASPDCARRSICLIPSRSAQTSVNGFLMYQKYMISAHAC